MRCFVSLFLGLCSALVAAAAAPAAEDDYIKVEVKGRVRLSDHYGYPGRGFIKVNREEYEFDLFPWQSPKDDKKKEQLRKETMRYDTKTVILKGTLGMESAPVRPIIFVEKITIVPESKKDSKK